MKAKQLLLVLIAGVFSMSVQGQAPLSELLSRLEGNHMGSIHDVFTVEEIAVLRAHFDAINTDDESYQGGGTDIFAPENNTTNSFGSFNSSDVGTFNQIGPGGTIEFEGAGCYNPTTGEFFVIDDAGNAYTVNPDTGVYTFQGTVTPPTGESVVGLEFDPQSQEIYAISTDAAGNSHISTFNPQTLALTPIGNTSLTLPIALAFNEAGVAYTYDIDNDFLYSIDVGTAAATSVGPIGFNADFGQGMFLNPTTGELFMTAFNADSFQSELRMINTTTGNTTNMGAIGATSPGGTLQFAWSATEEDPLSVDGVTLEEFQIYPNPVQNVLTMSAKGNLEHVAIYNMLGQKVLEMNLEGTSATVDVSGLRAGSYVAQVTINGVQGSQVFVRQ